jgi:lysophospholipase L1-like esterase
MLFSATTPSRKVWQFGDSLTYGTKGDNSQAGGYRVPMKAWLDGAGYSYQIIGTINGPFGLHDGHPGYTIASLNSQVHTTVPGNVNPMFTVLMGGTNDILQSVSAATSAAQYRQILAWLQTINYLTWILVTTIPPCGFPAQNETEVQALNAALVAEWDYYDANRPPNCPKLIRADVYTAMSGNSAYFFGTNVHPTDAGYAAMWAEFQNALTNSGVVG